MGRVVTEEQAQATLLGEELRQAFSRFATGVTAVCGTVGGVPLGMAVSAFTPVSLDPPLVGILVRKESRTWAKLAGIPSLGISVLTARQEALCKQLATNADEAFRAWPWTGDQVSGPVFVDGASLWLNVSPHMVQEAGDHWFVTLTVTSLDLHGEHDREPLVFHGRQFRTLA